MIGRVEAARAAGPRITADMYAYTAVGTGIAASMPPWVQDGGRDALLRWLKGKAVVARVKRESQSPDIP